MSDTLYGIVSAALRRARAGAYSFAEGSAMSNSLLLEKIDAAIAEKNLLKHPFYRDWQAGRLSEGVLPRRQRAAPIGVRWRRERESRHAPLHLGYCCR